MLNMDLDLSYIEVLISQVVHATTEKQVLLKLLPRIHTSDSEFKRQLQWLIATGTSISTA